MNPISKSQFRRSGVSRRTLLKGAGLAGGATALGGLAACSNNSAPVSDPDAPLNVAVFSHFEQLDARLNEDYDRPIEYEAMVADNHRDQIVSTFRAGSSPWDIIPLWSFITPEMAQRGWLTDLTDRILDEFGANDFEAIVGGPSPFQNSQFDGRMYAVPVDVGGTVLHWNKRALRERGIDAELPSDWHSTPGSIETFIDVAKELTYVENGVPHWGFADNWGDQVSIQFNTYLQMFGGSAMDFTNGDPLGQVSFNDSPGVDALQFMVDLLHKHEVVDPASVTYNWVFDVLPGFLDGRVGFISTWPFVAGAAQDPEQSQLVGEAGCAPNFSAVTSATSQDPHYIAIPTNAPAGEDAAWEYVRHRLSHSVQLNQGTEGDWAPIYDDLYDNPQVREAFMQADVIRESLRYPSSLSTTPDFTEWRATLSASLSRALSLELTPKEALDEAAEQVRANRGQG